MSIEKADKFERLRLIIKDKMNEIDYSVSNQKVNYFHGLMFCFDEAEKLQAEASEAPEKKCGNCEHWKDEDCTQVQTCEITGMEVYCCQVKQIEAAKEYKDLWKPKSEYDKNGFYKTETLKEKNYE